ncbi:hypothetical protein A2690_00700 [Candidatus Roizmanbacteria bacterium RIFCSPHIGHO2_01_FULL_39_12b]|uniref:Four helix bundle protein n=1 Tax=Candidatus Roizmanbacteria bacterium RIFCSPHIGHO2_01_FULL_39_12b TaxID=1802030 RepID=A0A1F7GAP0_9BACT|nr:MAG: hypothetical protein A2690_00700 [Candidatus Roizmanbacteria bacterium RIFCSPHIGHO2_01_FULL_39_12b]
MEIKNEKYHDKLKKLMDNFVNQVYDKTQRFPKAEIFGVVSQDRRCALSIVLNYIEGYARRRKLVLKNFLEISYGSAKEAKYLTYFANKRGYISDVEYKTLSQEIDQISKLLWGIIVKL